MNKAEFLAALSGELASVTTEEREAALDYYSEYFADAGVENEPSVLEELGSNRASLEQTVDLLQAYGNTALLDGVRSAYVRLQQENDPERINAIVVMTDGRENNSTTTLGELRRGIQSGNRDGVPVVIFAIAFGDDADYEVLRTIAESSGGQVRQGDLNTIREIYRLLSSYF